ncbi:MAG: outer membrane lipid asymmetry maintenance protein MlaD [Rhodobacter sp.]|jgi:phospholipid/cholesterol/gamma-HCH transport system substrate-binding protein|nr:outer membrane lipid asymmetry maintenance protein MlaD [Rhodobacter sp.]
MANQTTEVLVGGAVLAVAAGFFIYAAQVTGAGPAGGAVGYTASFTSVEGVSVGTDVRLGGVKVGTVTGLSLNPETFRADTSFTVDDSLRLPEDTAILISSEGLLGGSFVEILPGGSPLNLEPGAEVEDTQSAVSLINLLLKFVAGGDNAES